MSLIIKLIALWVNIMGHYNILMTHLICNTVVEVKKKINDT